jgi:hypothetical protein
MNIEELGRTAINHLRETYKPFPKSGFIAGGSLANLIWEFVSNNKAIINDIDVFIYDGEYKKSDNVPSLWNSEKNEKLTYLSTDKSVNIHYNGLSTSLVCKDYYRINKCENEGIFNKIYYKSSRNDLKIIIESFDINCTQIGYSIEEDKFYWTKDFEEFLMTSDLKLVNLLSPAHSVIRLVKKKDELNCNLSNLEIEICSIAISRQFRDINKKYFTEKYLTIFRKYSNILENHFEIRILGKMNEIFNNNELPDIELFQLNPIVTISESVESDTSNIYYTSELLFWIRNIKGNEYYETIWKKLKIVFSSKDYIDCTIDLEDIELISRIISNAPKSYTNLKDLKLSEQIRMIKTLMDKFKHDESIAIALLEKSNLKELDFSNLDEDDLLLLELSVRKEIVMNSRKVSYIMGKEDPNTIPF